MLELKTMPQATVTPGVPTLLQEGYYVKFSDHWPAALSHVARTDTTSPTGARGKFFQVGPVNPVPHDLSYKIPAGDFRDVDFSNTVSAFNENLYPMNPRTLYETVIGFKKANFLAHLYIPAGEYVKRLEQNQMVPNVASATLRYLGALKYRDSPYRDKRFLFYSVFQLEPFIMRLFVDSGPVYYLAGVLTPDFDKIVIGLVVNKCFLNEIANPTPDMLARAKLIRYYSELRW